MLDNVGNIKLGTDSINISYPKLIPWTNSSVKKPNLHHRLPNPDIPKAK
jgi:hypothetical protein